MYRKLVLLTVAICLIECVVTGCSAKKNSVDALFDDLLIQDTEITITDLTKSMTEQEVISAKNLSEKEISRYTLQGAPTETVIMTKQEYDLQYDEAGYGSVVKCYNFDTDKLYSVTYTVNYKDVSFDEAYTSVKALYSVVKEKMGDAQYIEEGSFDTLTEPGAKFQQKWTMGSQTLAFIVDYQDMSNAEYETDHVLWLNVIVNL